MGAPHCDWLAWYLWHSRVRSCGFHGLKGEPDFPAATALIVLLPVAPLVTAVLCIADRRSLRALAGLVVLAAALAGVAIGIAELAFIADRRCFE